MRIGSFAKIGGALLALAMATTAHANTVLVAGTGWIDDTANSAKTPTVNSTISFTVGAGFTDIFSLSDNFVPGDVYAVTIDGLITDDSTFTLYPTNFPTGLGDTSFDAAWTNPAYSHLQLTFAPGSYTLVIEDISSPGFGYPAGLGYRLDASAVPEAATWALLIAGLGLTGFALRRRGHAARIA